MCKDLLELLRLETLGLRWAADSEANFCVSSMKERFAGEGQRRKSDVNSHTTESIKSFIDAWGEHFGLLVDVCGFVEADKGGHPRCSLSPLPAGGR